MENDRSDAAPEEALRVAAAKRASIAKLAKRGFTGPKAERLVEAVYKHFPLPPEKAAGSSMVERKPDGD